LSAGAIYGHFASKGDIILDVATRVVGARVDDVQQLMASDPLPPPSHLLRVLMGGMLEDLGDPTILVQLWGEAATDPALRDLAQGLFAQLQGAYRRYISLWHQREHGVSEEEGDAIGAEQVSLFVSGAQGFIVQAALMPDFDRERYLTTLDKYLPR
ncbi:MAG TPA: TetR/AcrR family transcriptional regulator, partial [Rhodoglobus sp.]|nr:TetR/AcrR family transcriptional regulator [Rhodoglobus sp.]